MAHVAGRWRIVAMDLWDAEAIDLVGPGFIEFGEEGTGEFGFIAVRGWMDYRPADRDGRGGVEFSWQGDDEGDPVSGRGWAALADDGTLTGHLCFHQGDDSGFRAVPAEREAAVISLDEQGPVGGVSHRDAARIEREIEAAFDPGRYVSERGCSEFVGDLGDVAAEVARLVPAAPSAAVALYETFLAGCYGKAEEVDDSSGEFGDFVATTVVCGWITASQAAGADAGETAARLLQWMEEDPYGFCHRLAEHAVMVLDAAGLAALTAQVRARFDAAGRAGTATGEPSPNRGHALRRWAGVLRTLYAAQHDVDAYVELAEQTGLTAKDCHTVADMLAAGGEPERALSWVERGIEVDKSTPHRSFAGHDLVELKPRLLVRLGRADEAQDTAWAEYRKYPSRYAYDQLMTFAPDGQRPDWHNKAIGVAMAADTYLPSVIDLLLHTNETERLAELIGRSTDTALDDAGHSGARPAAEALQVAHPGQAARLWRAQGMRILAAKKSKHYDAALRHFERAKHCYEAAGLPESWRQLVQQVREQHGRKHSFMPGFDEVVAGTGPSQQPGFLEQAKMRWGTPHPDRG